MNIRFGTVKATPVGINPYWDLTVTGEEDIKAHQSILDKYDFKQDKPETTYTLHIAPKESDTWGNSSPAQLGVNGKLPEAGDIEGLDNLIEAAEPNLQRYNPNLFKEAKAAMQDALLNTAVAYLKEQGGSVRQAIAQINGLLKK